MESTDSGREILSKKLGFFMGIESIYHFLIKHKDEPSSLLKKNLTYDNLEKLGYSLQGMEMLGFSEEALEQLGYSNQNSSQTLHEITSDNHNAKRHMDTKESSLKEAIEAGYSLKELVEHYSCEELRKHFSVLELNTFFNGSQFREAGVSAREMREAGYSVLDLCSFHYPDEEIRTAGYLDIELARQGLIHILERKTEEKKGMKKHGH